MGEEQMTEEQMTFNERLIDAVRNSRCLYDSKDRQYRSTDYKIKVWNRLVQILGFDGDARTLYNRWKQLRDKYGKEKKKMKYTGDGTTWQYYKQLAFLDPFMVDRPTAPAYGGGGGKRGKNKHGGGNDYIDPAHQGHLGMQMITDPNFSEHLIHQVQEQPCLFDIRDPKYRHAECRNAAWADIIKNLNYQGDINSIYKQWKKIRDRYVREKRKMRMSNGGGGGANGGGDEEPAWDLYQQMVWIDPYLDDRASQVKRKRDSDELSFVMDGDDGFATGSGNVKQQMDDMHHGGGNHRSNMQQPQFNMIITNDHLQNQQLHMAPHPAQVLVTNSNGLLDSSEGDKAFALSVASDLRGLSENAKEVAKLQIQNILVSARLPFVK